MEKNNKIFLLNLFIVTIIFLIDRVSKIYVINLFEDINNQQIILTSFLNIYLIWNEGIAFGLFSFSLSIPMAVHHFPEKQIILKDELSF